LNAHSLRSAIKEAGWRARRLRPSKTLYDKNIRFSQLKVRSSERFLLWIAKDPAAE
jgi:hypothetical protein